MGDCGCAALNIVSDGTLAGTTVTKGAAVLEGAEKDAALVALAAEILADEALCGCEE